MPHPIEHLLAAYMLYFSFDITLTWNLEFHSHLFLITLSFRTPRHQRLHYCQKCSLHDHLHPLGRKPTDTFRCEGSIIFTASGRFSSVQNEPTGCTIFFQFISVISFYMLRVGLLLIIIYVLLRTYSNWYMSCVMLTGNSSPSWWWAASQHETCRG